MGERRTRDSEWEEPPRRGHESWARERFRCPDCPSFTFPKKALLDAHRARFHGKEPPPQ